MKALYLAIIAQLQTIALNPTVYGVTSFFLDIWNNQVESLKSESEYHNEPEFASGNRQAPIPLPAVFIELDNLETEQLGAGYQIYPDLKIRLHIVHRQEDAGDGTLDRNVDVLSLQDLVYAAFQGFQTTDTNEFIREHTAHDFEHKNIYRMTVQYATTYVDNALNQPVGGVSTTPPTNLVLDMTISQEPQP